VHQLCDSFCSRYISCLKGKMPFDLDDAEDKLPATTTTTTDDDSAAIDNDDGGCNGNGSSKRQRLDVTVPECYDGSDEDTINKVNKFFYITHSSFFCHNKFSACQLPS